MATARATRSAATRSRRRRLASPWLVASAVVAVALLAGGWFWLRNSSLVAVETVKVSGVHGTGGAAIRGTLRNVAFDMTTLNVDRQALQDSVRRFPIVKSLDVKADFPHGLRIAVTERRPVAALVGAGVPVAVASDGVLLRGERTSGLPAVTARVPYGSARLPRGTTLNQVLLLGGAPANLRGRVTGVTSTATGYVVNIAGYPQLRFGTADRIESKWAAARRILADPTVVAATYVDLRVPERPAVGPDGGGREGFVP